LVGLKRKTLEIFGSLMTKSYIFLISFVLQINFLHLKYNSKIGTE